MKNEERYCGVCHVVVAPADPQRLEHQGEIAHGSCVARDGFRGVRRDAEAFLTEGGGEAAGRQFSADVATARRPKQFADVLSRALARLYAASTNGTSARREAIAAFAAGASSKLYCDVAYYERGAPSRFEAKRA